MTDESVGDRERLRAVIRQQRQESGATPVVRPTSQRIQRRRALRRQQELRDASYHQARVLLLIDTFAGDKGKLDGLTKLAKLDFLLRYPRFLEELAAKLGRLEELPVEIRPTASETKAVESRMIRYKYGPWDDRYYGIIGALVGRGLVEYVESSGRLALRATPAGRVTASSFRADDQWAVTAKRCEALKRLFHRTSGNKLKNLIYENLPEVVDLPLRTEIQ